MTPRSVRVFRGQEDPLGLLTATSPIQYYKGAIIYSELKQPTHLHLVIRGRVKVMRGTGDRSVIIDVYGQDDFFGECALLEVDGLSETAVALEDVEVMRWTRAEIEQLVRERPQLGMSLMQTLARRTIDFGDRLQTCLGAKTARRVLQSLIRFSERYGDAPQAGSVRLGPLTHRLISEYIGTTREVVTQHMNRFRRQGLVEYSRLGIVLTPLAFEVAAEDSRPKWATSHANHNSNRAA
jgi:CRP/FNR family transcriptional regulator, cyclic AMP receptor protein